MTDDILKQASEALDSAIADAKRNKAFMAALGPAIVETITPVLNKIADDNRITKEELMKALSAMSVSISPEVNIPAVTLPEIKVPAFKMPEFKIPEIKIPPIKLPKVVMPKPEITINPRFTIPEIKIPTQVIKFPAYMDVRMKDVTQERPLPVFLMNPSSGSGPRAGLTLSDIVTPSGVSIIDNVNNALNVKTIGASLVGLTGIDFNIGPSGAQTIRTTIATDSVNSVNVQQWGGTAVKVSQGDSASATGMLNILPMAFNNSTGLHDRLYNGAGDSASALRIVYANDAVGSVVVNSVSSSAVFPSKETPDATSTYAPTNSDSTAYINSQLVKASAGVLYSVTGYNSSTSSIFIQIHNTSAQPNDGAAPVVLFTCAPLSNFYYTPSEKFGKYFATGIQLIASTTGPTKTLDSSTATWFNCLYQ